jgi:NO-binding membrane sensor protein with MHYT domain
VAAVVMGIAIVGMHYTGMAAANFPRAVCGALADGLAGDGLDYLVLITTLAVLAVACSPRCWTRAWKRARPSWRVR